MKTEVLTFIANHAREKFKFIAEARKLDPDLCLNTIDEILKNEGNTITLTNQQTLCLKDLIEPLIAVSFCEGARHYISTGNRCHGDVYIDDGCLSQCYMDNNYICRVCNYDKKN